MSLQAKVERVAYELYEKNGRREGRDLLDWLAAEQIVRFQQMIFPGMGGQRIGLLEYKPAPDAVSGPSSTAGKEILSRKRSGGNRRESWKKAS